MKLLAEVTIRPLLTLAWTSVLAALPAQADIRDSIRDQIIYEPTLVQTGYEEDFIWYVFGAGEYRKSALRALRGETHSYWDLIPSPLSQPLGWWRSYLPYHNSNQRAPDVKLYNGRYWMFYSVTTATSNESLIGLLSTTSLKSNNWRDHGLVIRSTPSDDFNALNGDLLIDAEGSPWLTFGSSWSGIKLIRLDEKTMKPFGALHSIATTPRAMNPIEAPNIVYKDGHYYLFVSFNKCCHEEYSTSKIAYGRSRHVTGPYFDKHGTAMMNGGGTILEASQARFMGPGHQDIYNNRLLIRHVMDLGRRGLPVMRIDRIHWDAEGWPTLDRNMATGINHSSNYRMKNLESGKLAEVSDWGMEDSTEIVQAEENHVTNQSWEILDLDNGYYRITNKFSDKVLEVSTQEDGHVRQGTSQDATHQQWRVEHLGDGRYSVINRHSGKALDGSASSKESKVTQQTRHGGVSQQWNFILMPYQR